MVLGEFSFENRPRKSLQGKRKEKLDSRKAAKGTGRPLVRASSHISAIAAAIARAGRHSSWHCRAGTWAGPSSNCVVGAQHADSGAKLGSAERDHVLADMSGNDLAVLRVGVRQDVLDEIVAVLVAGNVDQRDAWTIKPALADTVEVPTQKIRPANLQTFFDHLRGKLIHAVLGSIPDNMIDSPAAVCGGAMLTDVLNTPIAELTVGDDVNVGQDFLNAGAL